METLRVHYLLSAPTPNDKHTGADTGIFRARGRQGSAFCNRSFCWATIYHMRYGALKNYCIRINECVNTHTYAYIHMYVSQNVCVCTISTPALSLSLSLSLGSSLVQNASAVSGPRRWRRQLRKARKLS